MFNSRWAGGAAALAIAAALTPAAHAQFTSSDVSGRVFDGNGNPVAGAVVTITDTRTGRVSRATTSSNGTFFESNLAVGGPYTIEAETPTGPAVREGITLAPSSNSITLFAETVDTVVVTGRAQNRLDLNNGVGSAFSAQDILDTPAVERDLIATLNRDPLAQSGGTGNLSVAGSNPRFNGLAINGALLQDDFGLSTSTYPTARSPINLDAVENASLVAADYTVFASGFTGGLVNVVTKSGTNEFKGSAFYYTRNENWNGNQVEEQAITQAEFDEEEFGFTLGGPIIKDKLFFFVSYDEFESAAGRNFADEDAQNGVDPRYFDVLNEIVLDTYGIDMGGRPETLAAPQTSERLLATIDWNINDNHRAKFTYQETEENGLQSIGAREFSSAWYNVPQTVKVYTGEVFSDWTPNLSTQVRLNYKDNVRGQVCGNPGVGEIEIELTPNELIGTPLEGLLNTAEIAPDEEFETTGACDRFRHANEFEDERFQFLARADYSLQDHNISAAVEYESYDLFNLFVQRANGEFVFDGYDNLINGTAFVNYNNAPTNNADDAAAEWGYAKWSFLLQDQWRVADNFTVNYGLRYERFVMDDEPIDSPTFQNEYGFSSAQNLDGLDIWQPRVGFEFTPFDRTKLTGGFGLFSGGNPQVWVSNSFQGLAGNVRGTFNNVDPNVVPQALQDDLANNLDINSFVPIDVISPDFEIPSDWKMSLRLEQTFDMDFTKFGLPFGLGDNYQLTAQFIRTETNNGFLWRNLAQTELAETQPTGVAPDGRPIYADLDVLGISNVTELTNFDEGVSNVFTIGLSKRFANGFSFDASYAHQDIEAVTPGTSSRGISNWRAIVDSDRNFPGPGTSNFQVEHAFKLFFDFERKIFGDLTSKVTLFGDIQSGDTFSYTFNVDDENALFGRAGDGEDPFDNDLLYVPTFANGQFTDPSVVFASGFPLGEFARFVGERGMSAGIQPRGGDEGPWNQRWDLHFEQELPFANFGMNRFEGNRLKFVLDIQNIANMLDDDWGVFKRAPSFAADNTVRADLVSAADVAMNGVDGATALEGDLARTTCTTQNACLYRFNQLDNDPTGFVEPDLSFYQARVGFRYEW
ncbi:MAG: TonB-dependent receptor [Pseudomonadota bacterium]